MAGKIKHRKVSAVADGADTAKVRPQADWNDSVVMSEGASGNKAQRNSGATDGWDLVNYNSASYTNRAGIGLVDGDVVAVASAQDNAVERNNVLASLRRYVVAKATIADLAAGACAESGPISNVKASGAIARNAYVQKSATVEAVETTGVSADDTTVPPKGTLGICTKAAAGGFCDVQWFSETTPGRASGFAKAGLLRQVFPSWMTLR